jgi:hypothetical protein
MNKHWNLTNMMLLSNAIKPMLIIRLSSLMKQYKKARRASKLTLNLQKVTKDYIKV